MPLRSDPGLPYTTRRCRSAVQGGSYLRARCGCRCPRCDGGSVPGWDGGSVPGWCCLRRPELLGGRRPRPRPHLRRVGAEPYAGRHIGDLPLDGTPDQLGPLCPGHFPRRTARLRFPLGARSAAASEARSAAPPALWRAATACPSASIMANTAHSVTVVMATHTVASPRSPPDALVRAPLTVPPQVCPRPARPPPRSASGRAAPDRASVTPP